MGNGLLPGPVNGPGSPDIDEGTMPRVGSPPPGAIGLDARSGSRSAPQQSMSDRILAFARQRRGQRYGNGECFTLADGALRHAAAKSAADFGQVTPDADYVWGAAVTRAELRPGDVIQMRGYHVEVNTTTEHPDGSTDTTTLEEERPHHTAIVESIGANGRVTVLEQNVPEGQGVTRNVLYLTNSTTTAGASTTDVAVRGTFWFYRPEAR